MGMARTSVGTAKRGYASFAGYVAAFGLTNGEGIKHVS